jgi:Na+-translocating ferredoxin:NAD+ oxidoreductase RNF subunit RnfB
MNRSVELGILHFPRLANDDALSAEHLALGCKQLTRVELCWQTIKSGPCTRPLFHSTPHRLCADLSLCVLALPVESIAKMRAVHQARTFGWNGRTVRVELQLHNRATILARHEPAATT